MSEPTQFSLNETPKQKKKLPMILLIIVVILGVVIWRMKSAGGGSEPVAVPTDTVNTQQAPVVPEPAKPETTAVTPSAPAPEAAPAPKPEPAPAVVQAKPKHHMVAPAQTASKEEPVVASKPKSEPIAKEEPKVVDKPVVESTKPVVSEPAATPVPKPEVKEKVTPVVKAEPKPVVEQPKPEAPVAAKEPVAPVKSESKTPAAPIATTPATIPPATPAKKFVLEDQPMTTGGTLSEDSKLAVNTQPVVAAKSEAVAASPEVSDAYKKGMEAYKNQDYAAAVQQFKTLAKPTSKQRGNPVRDQFVEGYFLLGLSLLRTDHADEAAKTFQMVLEYEKYYPLANMNLGICYVELKQYFKANKAFEAVIRDQSYIEPSAFDDVMQRTKYFWALAWTRMFKTSKDPDKQAFFKQQAVQHWKDYQTWFGKNAKYRAENRRAEDYIRGLSAQ